MESGARGENRNHQELSGAGIRNNSYDFEK
jgi:hypothetical protein